MSCIRVIILLLVVRLGHFSQAQTEPVKTTSTTTTTTTTPPKPMPVILPEYVLPNASLEVTTDLDGRPVVNPDGSQLFGSTVMKRPSASVQGDAFTIQIDSQHPLTAGVLRYFYVYLHVNNMALNNSCLRLQIWRPTVDNDINDFRLVWQKRACLSDLFTDALYAFNVSEDEFQVRQGDLLGWTGEDNNIFVSREDHNPYPPCTCSRSRYILKKGLDLWLPSVRDEPYRYIRLSNRQFIFSAAVRIFTLIDRSSTVQTSLSSSSTPSSSSSTSVSSSISLNTTTTTAPSSWILSSSDHTVAMTLGVIFGVIGAVIIILLIVVIWKREEFCLMLRSKSNTSRDSRVELLDSGSSTPKSSENGDDVDSASVATTSGSSSSESAVGGRNSERNTRPKRTPAGQIQSHTFQFPFSFSSRPTTDRSEAAAPPTANSRKRFRGGEHDNAGFEEEKIQTRPETSQISSDYHLPSFAVDTQATSIDRPRRKSDGKITINVDVELHQTPQQFQAQHDDDNSVMI